MYDIEEKSITHLYQKDILSKEEISEKVQEIKSKLNQKYEKNSAEYNELNEILNDLNDCEFGRFIVYNGSLSGYWTHYVMAGYKGKTFDNKIEKFLLQKAPGTLATRERFGIFQKLLVSAIKENNVCCSVPCGLMTEFVTLDFDEKIENVEFVGVDLDSTLFGKVTELVKKYNKSKYRFSFVKADAWNMKIIEKFDVLTSNGLNMYEKNDDRVIELYKNFFSALKPGGVFIGSAPAALEEWDREKIQQENMELQKKIYNILLEPSWGNRRTAEMSESQLKSAGFKDIQFYWDTQKMFYTFKAKKPLHSSF